MLLDVLKDAFAIHWRYIGDAFGNVLGMLLGCMYEGLFGMIWKCARDALEVL